MKIRTTLLLIAFLISGPSLFAQTCDPWITNAYSQLYGRKPSSAECNIKNYNNGSWSSYCELVAHIAGYNRNRTGNFLKGDPWIFQAYCQLYNRNPTAWEVNIQLYNKGSWGTYNELVGYIKQYQKSMSDNGIRVAPGTVGGQPAAVFTDNKNNLVGINLVSLTGGSVVAAGGANVIAAGGANVVAAGGANLTISPNTAGVTFGSDRTIQSAGTRLVKVAGKSTLVFK